MKQCQKNYIPLPQVILDFLQVSIHVPKIAIERADSRLDDRLLFLIFNASNNRSTYFNVDLALPGTKVMILGKLWSHHGHIDLNKKVIFSKRDPPKPQSGHP